MKLVRSAILVAAAVVVPLVPTAAHADKYVQDDPAGDVVSVTYKPFATAPAPTQTEGDIIQSAVQHKARKVWLTMQFGELTPTGQGRVFYYGIRTPSMTRYVQVAAGPGLWGGQAKMFKPSGKKVRCHVSRAVNYDTNTATVGVPRSCLGKPRWVKGAMQEASLIDNLVYGDDARAAGAIYRYMVFTPRVRR